MFYALKSNVLRVKSSVLRVKPIVLRVKPNVLRVKSIVLHVKQKYYYMLIHCFTRKGKCTFYA